MTDKWLVDEILSSLKRGRRDDRERPHKPVLWITVLNLIDQGHISQNKIYFDEILASEFDKTFQHYAMGDDLAQLAPPFFHLRSSGIWHHQVKPGQEEYYATLTTSGGGSKRIKTAIDYAFISDAIYTALLNSQARATLREKLNNLLLEEARGKVPRERVGTSFHETFALNRPAIASVIDIVSRVDDEQSLTEQLREQTNLGTNYVKAMPRYARASGLMEFKGVALTPLGQHVLNHDPTLTLPQTQWLMHYHLCAPHGPGPNFWHELILALPEWPLPFGKADVVAEVGRSTQAEDGKELAERSISSTATVFLGSYTKSDALGPLGLIEKVKNPENEDRGTGLYTLETPVSPPPGVVGYALAHYWAGQYPNDQTQSIEKLAEPNGFAGLFLMGAFELNRALRALERQGICELWMVAPPYQITRLPAAETLLEGIYAAD